MWPSVDRNFYRPSRDARKRNGFHVCYAGRVDLANGIGYLRPAWDRLLLPPAELLLVGEIHPEMRFLLATYASASAKTQGWLTPEEVAKRYRESEVSVLPSVNAGLALALLEAMAAGLPLVASEMARAADCMSLGGEGRVVRARDLGTLADAICWCQSHPDEVKGMGNAARTRFEKELTLSQYEQRAIALHSSLAGML